MPQIIDPLLVAFINGRTGSANFLLARNGANTNYAWVDPATIGASGANPTASVGLSAVNGVATTYLRSDGAPALSQAIVPTWTGVHTFAPSVRTSGSASYLTATAPADTTLASGVECIGVNLNLSATRQFTSGALATQREVVIQAPTYTFSGASTLTTAVTVDITGAPIAGTNATITNAYALRVGGGFQVDNTGNINATSVRAVSGSGAGVISFGTVAVATGFTFNPASDAGRVDFACQANYCVSFGAGGSVGAGVNLTGSTLCGGPDSIFAHTDIGLTRAAAGVWRITGASAGGAGWLQNSAGRARLTADATNATATFSNLSDLTLTLIAGRKYTGRMAVKCVNSTATEGLKFDFNGGTATMTGFWAGAGILASGGTDVVGTSISTSLAGVVNFTTFTGESVVIFEISLVCNAAGTLIPRFAENTTAVGTATVRLGSYLWLEDSPN